MIWRARFNALFSIAAILGFVICIAVYDRTRSVWPFLLLAVLILAARFGFELLNTLATALTGKPLAYEVKIFDRPPVVSGVPPAPTHRFCTKCGSLRPAGANYCTECGQRHA